MGFPARSILFFLPLCHELSLSKAHNESMNITAPQGPNQTPIPERFSIKITVTPSFEGKKIYRIDRFLSSENEPGYSMLIRDYSYIKPSEQHLELDSQAAEAAVKDLLQTPFYICSKESHGLDGTDYLLEVSIGLQRLRFSWWEDLPQEWTGLSEILNLAGLLT